MPRRVVVTGIGLVSSLGIGTEVSWDALCKGCSGVGPITRFDTTDFSSRIAGEVKNFDPLRFIEKKDVKKMDAFIQYAIAASQFAMDDASLTVTRELGPSVGVSIGSALAGSAPSSASTSRCSTGVRGRSRRSSFRRRSSIWRPVSCRFDTAPRGRTRRPVRPARHPRMRSAMRMKSFAVTPQT